MNPDRAASGKGTWLAIAAFVLWGFFPIYWKWLGHLPALQLVSHRILWTCAALCAVIVLRREWRPFLQSLGDFTVLRVYLAASLLMTANWLVFILAVSAGRITESSLGYFISPLVSVLIGTLILKERLHPWQKIAVITAAAGVLYLTISLGTLPWMALALAFSFGCYGMVKKAATLGAVQGLALETLLVLPPAAVYLGYCEISGQGLLPAPPEITALILGSGVVSMMPLLLFAAAAQRIPLSHLGLLQYITPSMQLLVGILLFHEPFDMHRLAGFALVWLALLVFGLGSRLHGRQSD